MRFAGLIYDDSRHYIDHLAPFCALMNWPLIVCEETVADLIKTYYPSVQLITKSVCTLQLPPIVLSCDSKILLQNVFLRQKFETLWLPHGNSDKGWNSSLFTPLKEELRALVYGPRMIDFIHSQNVFPHMIQIGNFRADYFTSQKLFYDSLISGWIAKGKRNFLYAPTWDDYENNCSFWDHFPSLAKNIPSDCHLLIKLHPNTLRQFELQIERIKGQFAAQQQITFLPDFPPIYPLLSRCDAYIGDMSSIGYDFLYFDRPLFFLNRNPNFPLHQCGAEVFPDPFSLPLQDDYSLKRKELYAYTFTPQPDWIDALRCL